VPAGLGEPKPMIVLQAMNDGRGSLCAAAVAAADVPPALIAQSLGQYVRASWLRVRGGDSGVLPVIAGLVGIAVAWAIYSEQTIKIPAAPFWRRLLEHKFYFDELYDAVFYKPTVALANGLRRELEDPVILQTGTDLGEVTLETGGLVRRIQTGLLRTYVLFLAGGAAAVVLAFLIAK